MTKELTTSVCLLVAIAAVAYSAKFPSYWKKCPKENNAACIKKVIPDVMKSLKDGKRELGIIPIDPFHFEKLELNQGSSSPVNINLTLYNLDINGPSRVIVEESKVDWDNHKIRLDIRIIDGPASLIGDYTGSGKVLVLPLNGKGKANITLEDLAGTLILNGKEQVKNNKKYLHIEDGRFYLKPKRTYLYFENLFGGNANLGDNMNKFLNENHQEIISELNNTIANAIGEGFRLVANQFFQRVPLSDLYES